MFSGEHCVCSCVHPSRPVAEREGYLSARKLRVFQCSVALNHTRPIARYSILGATVNDAANPAPRSANLAATSILDFHDAEVQRLAREFVQAASDEDLRLQRAHRHLAELLRPVYSVDESRPASVTLRERKGSCSQRIACLEAVARALSIPTRVRALRVSGSFWYPRFPFWRAFIPRSVLLLWPQFFLGGSWIDFDEIHGSILRTWPLRQLVASRMPASRFLRPSSTAPSISSARRAAWPARLRPVIFQSSFSPTKDFSTPAMRPWPALEICIAPCAAGLSKSSSADETACPESAGESTSHDAPHIARCRTEAQSQQRFAPDFRWLGAFARLSFCCSLARSLPAVLGVHVVYRSRNFPRHEMANLVARSR